MKLLERLFDQDDKPVSVGSALLLERPNWLVTCFFERQKIFGKVSSKVTYEVAAKTEEKARKSVCSFLRHSPYSGRITSVQVTRQ